MKIRIFLFLSVVIAAEVIATVLGQAADPQIRTTLAVAAVNGDGTSNAALRGYESMRYLFPFLRALAYAAFAAVLFFPHFRGSSQK